MSSLNRYASVPKARTFEGAVVNRISAEKQLERMTLANMLWEDQFYIDGKSTADIIAENVAKAKPSFVADLARKARTQFKLRHVPLLLARELARKGALKAETLSDIIQRPDEMPEFLSIYWKDGKSALSNQVKKGLATAFTKFNEYSLAKWDKNSAAISMRDVMFLTHPKPKDAEQAELFKRVANQELKTPDTWEVALSGGADKKETFERLMAEKQLGALAFLRNLRNMINAGVSEATIRSYSANLDVSKVLPFRFIAAAKIVPQFEDMLEAMMLRALKDHPVLPGKTVLLVDVSGSMFGSGGVSKKSDLERFDAAAALAMLCKEICESVAIYTFSDKCVRVAPRSGFALRDVLYTSQNHNGTDTGRAVASINANEKYDRCIIFTDEQSHTAISKPKGKGYVINVAAYQNGLNHGDWTTISGFSEAVIDYIQAAEQVE